MTMVGGRRIWMTVVGAGWWRERLVLGMTSKGTWALNDEGRDAGSGWRGFSLREISQNQLSLRAGNACVESRSDVNVLC